MKKFLLFTVLALFIGCGEFTDYADDFQAINDRIDKLEQNTIPTINEQIEAINLSLAALDATDKELKGYIDNLTKTATELQKQIDATNAKIEEVKAALQDEISTAKADVLAQLDALKAELESELAQINDTIENLKAKDAELDKKIDDLRSYVDNELSKTTDWANATFATLAQYKTLVDEVSAIKTQIEAINKSITDLETRLTTKIKEDIETAVAALNADIQQKVAEITAAYTEAVKSAKEEITAAYTTAIQTAIDALDSSLKLWVGEQLSNYYTIAQVDALLATLTKDIDDKLETQKAYLEGLINELSAATTESINTNKALIDALRKDVTSLQGASAEQAAQIAELASYVSANAQKIMENAALIAENRNDIDANKALIDENRKVIEEAQQYINLIKSNLSSLVGEVTAFIAKTTNDIANNAKNIAKNAELIAQNAAAINNNAAAIAQNTADILKLQEDLATAKAEITEAYTKAIEKAINENNGKIEEKIANEVSAINKRIDNEVAAINASIEALTKRVAALEEEIDSIKKQIADILKAIAEMKEDISKLLARIQSISYIPQYDDGKASVKYTDDISRVTLDFEISPKDAVAELAKVWQDAMSLKAVYTETRAVSFIDLPIVEFEADADNGVITVTASGETLSAEFFAGTQSASVRLSISDGNSSVASEYIPMVAKSSTLEDMEITTTHKIYYTSSDGAVVTPNKSDAFGAKIVSNIYKEGKGVISFDSEVTTIGAQAFAGCSTLTSITIPATITACGEDAFAQCEALEAVYISDLAAWCAIQFSNSYANPLHYRKLYLNGKLVTDMVIPDGVKSIGNYAFEGCTSLTSVHIPDSVTHIGDYAFRGCVGLTSIYIPDSVTHIGDYAFSGCTALVSFKGDVVSDNNGNQSVIVGGDLIVVIPGEGSTHYDIPDEVVTIRDGAFANYGGLTSVTIGISVISIGKAAFEDCTKLESVYCKPTTPPVLGDDRVFDNNAEGRIIYVPTSNDHSILNTYKSAEYWSEYADYIKEDTPKPANNVIWYTSSDGAVVTPYATDVFGANIVSNTYENGQGVITFDGDVTQIGKQAFYNCATLTSISIPNTISKMNNEAFYGCKNLKRVDISDLSAWCRITFSSGPGLSPLYNSADLYLNGELLTDLVIPSDITVLNFGAFYGCTSLKSVTIPSHVTTIGWSAFCQCISLTDVTIEDGVTTLDGCAFSGCSGLAEITIPNSVTSIGKLAFYDCNLLTSVTIPNSVTSIGEGAFSRCASLEKFYGKFASADNCCLIVDGVFHTFAAGCGKTEYTIPAGITAIGGRAFYYCQSLTSVTIPDSVTSIENYAFYYCKSLTDITIPDSVTSIGDDAFWSCSSLTSITIPDSVTSIGYYAFSSCKSLTDITIPDSVTSIGYYAFSSCSSLTNIYCKPTTPPTAVASSSNYWRAFNSNASGRKIYVPAASVEAYKAAQYWSDYADYIFPDATESTNNKIFYTSSDGAVVTPYATSGFGANIVSNTYANGQGVITFDNEVTQIGTRAFYKCATLTSITIPDSVTEIGYYAFYSCTKLTSVTIPDSVTSIGEGAFGCCDALTGTIIGNGVTLIEARAFMKCNSLISITIPNSVTRIGDRAFTMCRSLTSVTIGNGITTISGNAFFGCTSLRAFYGEFISSDNRCLIVDGVLKSFAIGCGATEYTIPNSVRIEQSAFSECTSLTSVTIPDSVTSIGNNPFTSCSSLSAFYGKFASEDNRCLIDNGVLTSFAPAGLTEYTIPDNVTSIGWMAFCYCSKLTNVTIPDSITKIGSLAFQECTSLTNVAIPNSVTSIDMQAFYDCKSLKEVYCKPTTPPTGGNIMFHSNASGRKIYVPAASVEVYRAAEYWSDYADYIFPDASESTNNKIFYTSSDGAVVTPYATDVFGANIVSNTYENGQGVITFDGDVTQIGESAFYNCATLTSITIPNSVTSTGNSAFNNCTSLTSITIPDSVTEIKEGAFSYCYSLASITIPNSVTSIGRYAFRGCTSLKAFYGKFASADNRCLIVDGVLKSFAIGCGATEYTIPDSVTSIGDWAFSGCTSLTSVTIPDSVTEIGNHAFQSCKSLTSVTIPDSVTEIGNHAFYNCIKLTSVTIGNSVTKIGDYAFYNCIKLTSATIGNGVTSIGTNAFYNCTSLTSIIIPDSVTTIGTNAFCNCTSLTEVYCKPTTPPTGGSRMFSYYSSSEYKPIGCKIYVPAASVEAYKSAKYWSECADYIVGFDF